MPGLLLAVAVLGPELLLEVLHHPGVAQRSDVTELPALGDVAQQAAHDLARPRLGQVGRPNHPLGPGELADPLGYGLADVLDEVVVALVLLALESHEGADRLPAVLSDCPITAASATRGWWTMAFSISAVDMRWPETLIT